MKLLLKISLLILAMFVVNVNPTNAIIVLQKLMQIKISFRKEMTKYIYKVIENGSTNIVGMEMIQQLNRERGKVIEANAAKTGWKVGEPITNLALKGNVPAWSTVRQRFWKNEALLNGSTYSESNLLRMQKGLAPQRINPNTGLMESMELHYHIVPQRNGGLFDFMKVWPDEYRALDPFRK